MKMLYSLTLPVSILNRRALMGVMIDADLKSKALS